MPKIEFTIPELYRATFGYIGLPFPLGDLSLPAPDIVGIAKTLIGKNDFLGHAYFMPIRLNGIWLPNSPTLSINGLKKIKTTAISGGEGTVKELVSIDDYKLQIRGFCINHESNDYPYEDVETIEKIWEVNKTVDIMNDLCGIFGINNVVLETFNFPEILGVQNVQAFELNLLSDNDFDVLIVE